MTVHTRAINILRSDGLVASIVDEMASMTGMAARVPALFAGASTEPAAGCPVSAAGTQIEITGLARLELAGSQAWSGTIDDAALSRALDRTLAAVLDALCLNGKPAGLLGLLCSGSPKNLFVEKARTALSAGRLEALVGLGPGLTPAGDDFLTGALMALSPRSRIAALEEALSSTTPAGRTLLWQALRRSFPAYLVAFARSIAGAGSSGQVTEAVRAACAHGETSGSDALTGFCWAASQRARVSRSSI